MGRVPAEALPRLLPVPAPFDLDAFGLGHLMADMSDKQPFFFGKPVGFPAMDQIDGTALVRPEAIRYLNRLSDHLFVMARTANDGGMGDVLWIPGGNR